MVSKYYFFVATVQNEDFYIRMLKRCLILEKKTIFCL